MVRRALFITVFLLLSLSLNAQKAILESLKPTVDSVSVLAREHFRVKSFLKVQKAMKRGDKLDLYFTKELSDLPWRKGDTEWMRRNLKTLWPDDLKQYALGSIFCESVDLEELPMPSPGNDGKSRQFRFSVPAPERSLFIERVGDIKADKGMRGRNIALWQSHGRFYDNGAGCWSWQRTF